MSEQQYAVDCSCGKEIPVTASMAGSNVACSCGAPVAVPRLSELRQRVGLAAYESGIIDTIHRMVNTGELPYGNECVISGMQTTDAFVLRVECERKWIKGAGKRRFLFLFLLPLLPFWLIWLAVAKTLADEPREELGRDTSVDVPLRVHCESIAISTLSFAKPRVNANFKDCFAPFRSTRSSSTNTRTPRSPPYESVSCKENRFRPIPNTRPHAHVANAFVVETHAKISSIG